MGQVFITLVSIFLSAIGLFISTTLWAQQEPPVFVEFAPRLDLQNQFSLDYLIGADPLTLSSLAADQELFQSYEEFLNYLQKRAPEIWERPVLIHSSGSLQLSTFAQPRVLLFGRGVVLAFSEFETGATHHVEMLEFDPQKSTFHAHEIVFSGNKQIQFRRNPQECIACHGTPIRPVWEPYDVWPKAYGTHSGRALTMGEADHYSQFLQQERRGVYAQLKTLPSTEQGYYYFSSIESLTEYLSTLNGLRVTRQWREQDALKPFRYAMAGILNGCTSPYVSTTRLKTWRLDEFLPLSLIKSAAVHSADLQTETKNQRAAIYAALGSHLKELYPTESPSLELTHRLDWETEIIADARFVLENNGVLWQEALMSHGENLLSLQVPSHMAMDWGGLMSAFDVELVRETEPNRIGQEFGMPGWLDFDCEKLATRSRQVLVEEQAQWKGPIDTNRSGLAPMARCVACHSFEVISASPQDLVPYIPFHDGQRLRQWLERPGNMQKVREQVVSGKMPKGSRLSSVEREALLSAFERFLQ